MEMGLLTRYIAPFMELSSRMYPRPAPHQLPVWTRHNPRGGLSLVSHGDCRRQDNWGAPLCLRFLASAANSVSSVSARPQYFPAVPARAGCHRQHYPSSSARNDTLPNSARAQGRRLFCSNVSPFIGKPDDINHVPASLGTALNKHKKAVAAKNPKKMVEALESLKKFADDKYYCEDESDTKDILLTVVSSLGKDQLRKHGGVVKESLEVARLLLQNTTEEILIQLCQEVELKPILESIIQDYGGSADHEVIKLANEILAKLPSTSK